MNPTDTTAAATSVLSIDNLVPSTLNPRKRFDEAALAELVASIGRLGVLQPLIVRAHATLPCFEIVAGERRWRAAKLAVQRGHEHARNVPAIVRQLNDLEALELNLVEQRNRADLHPLEEAEAYERMLLEPPWYLGATVPRAQGYGIDELAARVGVHPNHVHARLRLLSLAPESRNAYFAGAMQTRTALAVARLTPAQQHEALQHFEPQRSAAGDGAPWDHDAVQRYVRARFMLRLAQAPFDQADTTLVPEAGSCQACRKRTGAAPELFDDIAEADTCTDSDCHAAKLKAHAARVIDAARAKGHTVLTGAATKDLMPYGEQSLRRGLVVLDKPSALAAGKKPLAELVGDDLPSTTVLLPEGHTEPIRVAKEADVKAALKKKGLLRQDKPTVKGNDGKAKVLTEAQVKSRRASRIVEALSERLLLAVARHLEGDKAEGFPSDSVAWMREVLAQLDDGYSMGPPLRAVVEAVTGKPRIKADPVEGLGVEQLCRVAIVWLLCNAVGDDANEYYFNGEKKAVDHSAQLAREIGFDLAALRAEIEAEVDAAIGGELEALKPKAETKPTTPAKKKPAAKKASKADKPLTPEQALAAAPPARAAAVKYRNAETGETWTGRGLRPKWLKAALVSGKTLADFEVAKRPAAQLSAAAAWPFPPGHKPAAPPTARPAAKLSAEAAWPVPKRSDS